MMKSCKIKTYLANLAVWNVKLHNIHWNVVGPYFVSVHEYTEKLYDEVFEAYDAVAELLKMRGKTPLSTMKAYLERRKGRPVSMRDGRRLNYLSKEERAQRAKQMQEAQAAQGLQTP